MIDLFSWDTSNGRKVAILLEELELEHIFHPIDITRGEQHEPAFLTISPNNKIPAIVDSDGPNGKPVSVFESGAILIYLTEKLGSPLLPRNPKERMEVLQWLMFQMGGLGPMLGQHLHFVKYSARKIPYAIERYEKEAHRLLRVLEKRLGEVEFLGGAYSIADIACYPWIARKDWMKIDLAQYPHIERWFETISRRPAVNAVMNADPGRYTVTHHRVFSPEPPKGDFCDPSGIRLNPAGPVPFRWRAVLPGELHSTPWRIVAHPSDPMLILTVANLGRLLRSKDGGESWVKLEREFGKVRGLVWQRG